MHLGNNPQRIGKEIKRLGNKNTSRGYPNYSIIKISHNTETSPADLRRLAVTQTPEENYQLVLVWKTVKWVIIIIIMIDSDANCSWDTQCSHQRIYTRTRRLGNKRMNREHPNYSIVEISQNTQKSPGDLRRLGVNQNSVKNHQHMLRWKTLRGVK